MARKVRTESNNWTGTASYSTVNPHHPSDQSLNFSQRCRRGNPFRSLFLIAVVVSCKVVGDHPVPVRNPNPVIPVGSSHPSSIHMLKGKVFLIHRFTAKSAKPSLSFPHLSGTPFILRLSNFVAAAHFPPIRIDSDRRVWRCVDAAFLQPRPSRRKTLLVMP